MGAASRYMPQHKTARAEQIYSTEQTPRLPFQRKQRPDILTSKQRHSIRPHERNSTEQTLSLPFEQRQRPDTCHSIRQHERNRYAVQNRLRACPSSGSSVRISLHQNKVT